MSPHSKSAGSSTSSRSAGGSSRKSVIKSLGKYSIKKKIGAGGMGTVYLAEDAQLKRVVALKVLSKEKASNPTLVKRFKSEGQAAAHLKHDNIVTVYEAGEIDGYFYIALEYIEGTDVHNLVARRGVLPVKRSVEIVKQIARALQHAHEKGIVHRDIKPSNLLISRDGAVKLADLGLARSVDDEAEAGITRAGTTVGTVDYMSPEQARDSKSADVRSDIYSLGCTWYQMLTGKPPYPDGDLPNKLAAHATKPAPDPSRLNESVPEGIVAVMRRMMAKIPAERYQTPDELLEDLANANLRRTSVSDTVMAALSVETQPVQVESDEAPSVESQTADAQSPARKSKKRKPTEPKSAKPKTTKSKTTERKSAKRQKARRQTAERQPAADNVPPAPQATPPREKRANADPQESGVDLTLVKNAVVVAAGMGLIVLIWWVVTQFAAGIVDPASNVNPFADSPGRPDELSGGPSIKKGKRDGQSPDGTNNDQQPDGTRPKKGKKRPTASKKKPRETTNPPVNVVVRQGEEKHVPKWVADTQVGTSENADARPTVTVGRGSEKKADFTDLRKALLQLQETGGTVRLVGDGPFFLKPLEEVLRAPVVIRAEAGGRPLVMFTPGRRSPSHALLRVSNSSLSLIGIHLAVVAEQFPAGSPVTLIEVDSGNLTIRDSSVTLRGTRSERTIAFQVSGSKTTQTDDKKNERPHVVIERTFVRGSNLLPLAIDAHVVDVYASNSLFATGPAPMLRLTSPAREPAGKKKTTTQREIRFLSCTVYCAHTAFELVHGVEAADPPTTVISTVNSLFGPGMDSKTSALVRLAGWPAATGRASKLSGVLNLSWESDSSLFLGWADLVVSQPARYLKAASADSWNALWKSSADGHQFQDSAQWPGQTGDLASLAPGALDATTVSANRVRATDGGDPGCLVADLSAPQPVLIGRAVALTGRPITPVELTHGFAPTKTIKVDLGKQKVLGAFIEKTNWPSGTLIVVSGSGSQKSSAIRVEGKSLRIRFVQAAGQPLVLEPRDVNPNGSGRAKQDAESFISVTDGSIQLIGGDFKIPLSTRRSVPSWFLNVENGDFSLLDCSVRGPIEQSVNYSGLIRWKQRKRQSGANSVKAGYTHHGLISDSFLTGKGTIIQADMRGQSLRLNNSVLVAFDDLFELDITGADPNISAAVDIARCTLSAGGTFFNVKAGFLTDALKSPLRFFAEQTVFGKPVVSGTGRVGKRGQVLISYNAGAREENQMTWWGSANGFAGEITHFVHDLKQRKTSGRQKFSVWRNLWGTNHVVRELSADGDVEFAKGKFPDRHKLALVDFTLHSDSRASGWGHGGRPIGADIASLRVAASKNASTDGKKKDGKKTKRPRVDF